MNKYRRLVIKFKEAKDRFNRELYVKEDLTLYEIGCVIAESINAQFYHYFLFEDKEREYVDAEWVEDFEDVAVDYKTVTLNDLILPKSNTFTYEYDTGDSWDFSCKLYSKVYELDREEDAFCTGGVGYGIWEDRAYIFREYLDGTIDEAFLIDCCCDIEEYEYYVNEFEQPLDLDEINELISEIEGYYDDIYDEHKYYNEDMLEELYDEDIKNKLKEYDGKEPYEDYINRMLNIIEKKCEDIFISSMDDEEEIVQ